MHCAQTAPLAHCSKGTPGHGWDAINCVLQDANNDLHVHQDVSHCSGSNMHKRTGASGAAPRLLAPGALRAIASSSAGATPAWWSPSKTPSADSSAFSAAALYEDFFRKKCHSCQQRVYFCALPRPCRGARVSAAASRRGCRQRRRPLRGP